jgi:Protease inhibitor Inh
VPFTPRNSAEQRLAQGMTERGRRDSVRATATMSGSRMSRRIVLAVIALALTGLCPAGAQAPEPSDAAKDMVGAWEISNAPRDKTCPLTFRLDPAVGGYKLELDTVCGTAFPSLKDVVSWAMGPNDAVRLFDSKGAIVLDFMEVESHMYEAERKGEGLFFMRTQAAIKAATVSPEQIFGEWTLFREFEKPLCKLTLSNASAGGNSYKIVVKPGCDAAVAGIGLTTWRLDADGLLLSGNGGRWRFSESDATSWERIPASTDPMVLMRQ